MLHNKEIQGKPVSIARLYYYQMLIDDKRSEDSSFFKKSASIDSILGSAATPQLKAIMHLLQGIKLLPKRPLDTSALGTGTMCS